MLVSESAPLLSWLRESESEESESGESDGEENGAEIEGEESESEDDDPKNQIGSRSSASGSLHLTIP